MSLNQFASGVLASAVGWRLAQALRGRAQRTIFPERCSSRGYTYVMPSPHRRIGLVIDEDMDSALDIFRDASRAEPAPEASLARRAVFEGTLIEALMKVATHASGGQERAAALLHELREMLPTLRLPEAVTADLEEALGRVTEGQAIEERKRRQIASLSEPNPYGRAALELTDTFDALESLPPR